MPITVSSPMFQGLSQGKNLARKPQASKPTKSSQQHSAQNTVDTFQPLFAGRNEVEVAAERIKRKIPKGSTLTSEEAVAVLTKLGYSTKRGVPDEYWKGKIKAHFESHASSPRLGQSQNSIKTFLVLSRQGSNPIKISEVLG